MKDPRVWNYQELLQRRYWGRLLGWLALAAFVLLALVVVRIMQLPSSVLVTISSGNAEGTVQQFLMGLVHDASHAGLDIEPAVTEGTLDMLRRVDSGNLDFAIVQGGFEMGQYKNVRQVGVLSVAPVHLAVKEKYHAAVLEDLRNLRGRTINLGRSKNSVTYWLGQEILAFVGLRHEEYHTVVMTSQDFATAKQQESLPDAVFLTGMLPSEVIRRLVVDFGYRLIPLPFEDAFRLAAIQQAARKAAPEEIRKEHIVAATIPAYAYEASPPVPPQAIATLGCRILLITNRHTDRATVVKVLDLVIGSRFAEAMQPTLDDSIVRQAAEVPWHEGALDYRRRDEPVVTGERIGVLSNALQIVLPASGAILLFWGWLRNRVLTKRELRFDRFIALVSGVERRAIELEQGGTQDRPAIRRLHRELCTIKDAALERIAVGEASDNALVLSLFSHIGDVRVFLGELERSWNRGDATRGMTNPDISAGDTE